MDASHWSVTANGTRINKTARLINAALIKPGARCEIQSGACLDASLGRITLGSDCSIREGAVIEAASADGVSIGDRARILEGAITRARFVGNDVLIGRGALVLDGAVLLDFAVVADGAEIAAGSIVHGCADTAACSVAASASTGLLAPPVAALAGGTAPPSVQVSLAGALSQSSAGSAGFAPPLAWAYTTPPTV